MLVHLICVGFCLFNIVSAGDLKYFSNFKPGPIQVGRESIVKDFVTITNNQAQSALLFLLKLLPHHYLFEILKKDGTHWYCIA